MADDGEEKGMHTDQSRLVRQAEGCERQRDVYVPRGVSSNRQGWRARLAHVEMLLAKACDRASVDVSVFMATGARVETIDADLVAPALAEVRAILDGE
jgi:hypothetical protein